MVNLLGISIQFLTIRFVNTIYLFFTKVTRFVRTVDRVQTPKRLEIPGKFCSRANAVFSMRGIQLVETGRESRRVNRTVKTMER